MVSRGLLPLKKDSFFTVPKRRGHAMPHRDPQVSIRVGQEAEGAGEGVGISPCGSHGQGRVSTLRIVCCVCSVAQPCPTLCDPMDCSSPCSSVHGILQARVLEWVAISFSRESSQPRDQTCVSCVCCIGRQVLYH